MSTYKNHILTEKNIVILFDDKTLSYPRSHKLFAKVKKNLQAMNFRDLDLLEEIQVSGKKSSLPSGVTIKAGIVRVDKKRLPDTLEEKIISFWEKGLPLFPIINFYRNMMKNPSEESRKDLFTFLMENRIPITEKGMFRAYKKVREDMTDSQTAIRPRPTPARSSAPTARSPTHMSRSPRPRAPTMSHPRSSLLLASTHHAEPAAACSTSQVQAQSWLPTGS